MGKRSVKIGDCTLYHGDAMEILPGMVADCIVVDPPYRLVSGGNTTGEMGGCFAHDEYDNSGSIVECDIDWGDFMPLLSAALPLGHAYIMANNRNVLPMLAAAEVARFGFHNILVWDKGSATPNRWYMKNCEFIGFFYKGKAKYINDCGAKQLISCPQIDETKHPTEKPVSLMRYYIEQSTMPGQIVLDPFMGSGTTGVAAAACGRQFIGIEKNEEFFEMAVRRIRDAADNFQGRLL